MLAYTPTHPVKTGQPRKNFEVEIQNFGLFLGRLNRAFGTRQSNPHALSGSNKLPQSLPQISFKERNRVTNVTEK
ncbi:MAG: hypothetical protein HWD62_08555 [Cyclobacteriaceae bacterium]|nr:MAG: hypothetical protein HWD62_08555 [Cyclobacteriaceae bacterium]